MINGLHHIAMLFGDNILYNKTIRFYSDTLNFKLEGIYTVPGKKITMLSRHGFRLEIILAEMPDNSSAGRFVHIALQCESPNAVDVLYNRCLTAGCTSINEPGDKTLEPYISDENSEDSCEPMYIHNAFVQGLSGELIEFIAQR